MLDPAALLATILARPADDGPRLVYADWLEEQGECDRAEFIRVQCELARCEHIGSACRDRDGNPVIPDVTCDQCGMGSPLRRRERELLASETEFNSTIWDNKHLWACGPLTDRGDTDWTFRRGFVESVALSWADWGGGVCRECQGFAAQERMRDNSHYHCPSCSTTGRTSGHAAAIRASQPVTKCKLTTIPSFEDIELVRGDLFWRAKLRAGRVWVPLAADSGLNVPLLYIANLLLAAETKPKGRWPGVEFKLPQEQEQRITVGNRSYTYSGTSQAQPDYVVRVRPDLRSETDGVRWTFH